MSESEQTQSDDRPRFSRAILGRILAVGLFIALGTFAVMQSMQPKHKDGINDGEPVASASEKDRDDQSKKDAPTTASNPASKIPALNKSEFKTPVTASGYKPDTKVPTTLDTSPGKNSFGPPASKAFNTPVKVAKPVTPQDRYALAQGGTPVTRSYSGFGTRDDGVRGAIGDAASMVKQGAVNTANNLKTNTKDAANSLLNTTGQKINDATNGLRNKFGNFNKPAFGPTAKAPPLTAPPIQSKTSFAPPAVKTNFGAQASKAPINNPIKVAPIKNGPITNSFGATNTDQANPAQRSLQNKNPITTPARTQAPTNSRPSISPFASTNNSQTATTRAQAPPVTRSLNSNSVSSSIPPEKTTNPRASQNSFSSPKSSFSNTKAQIQTKLPTLSRTTPARNVSTSTNNNRATSRLPVSNAGPLTLLARNTPGDRERDGVQAPALTVEKLSPTEIQVDQPAEFEIVVKNVGRVDAEDVRVFDLVPDGTVFQTASPEPDSASNGKLQWLIGKLRPGQEKRIKLQLKPVRPGEIGSVAHVTFSTTASMRTLVTKPVLEIIHGSNPTHLIGDDVIFDVTVKNKGDGAAKNVLIQEDVPRQLEYQEGYRELEYEIGTLQPGQSRRVQLSLKAAEIGKLRNIMFASAEGGIRSKHEIDLEVIAPKLIAKTDGPTVRYLQRNVSHSFSVSNSGTAPATNVEMVARLPSGLRYVSSNNQGRYDGSNHSVYWSLAQLARDVSADVELKTIPVEAGNQPIKFETFADLDIRANAEQPLTVEHLVDVFFDIDDVVDPIEIGSDTSYRIRIVNQGTKTATNVQMQIEFPNGLQPSSVDGSLRHNISGQRIAFEPINSMSPGDEISFVVTASGRGAGDHRVVVNMRTDGRSTPVSKEETTRVYSDR